MDKIVRIHENILEHLLKLRQSNNDLFFVPRKINNQNRLDKGYWFIGNSDYLHLSFWNGTDWKEKVNNIGFVVNRQGAAFIELSAQDSGSKAKFMEKLVSSLGGFKKDGSKNKWHKPLSSSDYIRSLDEFIQFTKPKIDTLVTREKPTGIKLLDEGFFSSHIKKIHRYRQRQIELGETNKLSRICWNTEQWKFPSGSKGKSLDKNSFESKYGFGHEEWLFDRTRTIGGYHYASLQSLNLKTDLHEGKVYNVSLFSINNLNHEYYVGDIKNVECISKGESARIHKEYRDKGWFEQMRTEVERVGGDADVFKNVEPGIFCNIRFRFSDVYQPDELLAISSSDINITSNRYKLLPKKSAITFGMTADIEEMEGNKKSTAKRKRVFNSESEYDPYHDKMQNALHELLKDPKLYNYRKVFIERDHVDIKAVTHDGKWHYFELKSDNPKLSIRKALGQILEYAYYPKYRKAEKLIIVAGEKPNSEVLTYLNHIRTLFSLPITYRYFDLERNFLSDDY